MGGAEAETPSGWDLDGVDGGGQKAKEGPGKVMGGLVGEDEQFELDELLNR